MPSIDDFIQTPLLITTGIGVLLIILLLISKIRNTCNASIIFFVVIGSIMAGAITTLVNGHYFYFIMSVLIAQVLTLPYLILKAVDNPKKREEKKAQKKLAEQQNSLAGDEHTKEIILEIENKNKKLMDMNRELIYKVSTFFSNEDSVESFLDYCNKTLSEKVNADGCVILIADDYDNTLAVKSLTGSFPPPYKLPEDLPHKPLRVETNLRFSQFPFKGNVFGDVYTEGQPILVTDSVRDPHIYINGPEDFLKPGTYIFVPIKQQDYVVGVIALARLPEKDKFTEAEFNEVILLSDAIATAIKPLYSFLAYAEKAELSKDGSIASKYQKSLLPQKLPVINGLQIGCFSNPVENVCGDYYDVLVARRDKLSFVMADVAGKGMNSLVVMIMIRAILRLAVNTDQAASTILSWANRGICLESSKIDHFASVALINYNTTTKQAQIATCGNNPVYHFNAAANTLSQISTPSEPMGVEKDTVYSDINITLNKNDLIVTCTDGLLESLNENGVQYSTDNLQKVLLKNCSANAKDITNMVKEDLKKYSGGTQQYDDQSLLVIKIQ
ncbi:MAG: SpoIIE family protein phosphatase [Treponema sp.]|nr:SpoIIE family protein phosphatase [Treponema sp.]